MDREKLVKIFNKQTKAYEKKRKKIKSYDNKLRKKLVKDAFGRVLEVSVGAGNNFPFYTEKVENIEGYDISPLMIEKAKIAAEECNLNVKLEVKDVEQMHFEENSFETVVSTLSLCSYTEPEKMLYNFKKCCKPGGKILLLEHGLSRFRLYAWLQNKIDGFNVRHFGCHKNRDIKKLIDEAGISIYRYESRFLGVLNLVWAYNN